MAVLVLTPRFIRQFAIMSVASSRQVPRGTSHHAFQRRCQVTMFKQLEDLGRCVCPGGCMADTGSPMTGTCHCRLEETRMLLAAQKDVNRVLDAEVRKLMAQLEDLNRRYVTQVHSWKFNQGYVADLGMVGSNAKTPADGAVGGS